jgi:16S rRNA (guanine1207-N2)-methyltransferase
MTGIDLPAECEQKFQLVVIQLPKGRQLWRRWLVQAYAALTGDGSLYITGSNHLGIQSALKDTQELFGPGRLLAYKKGNRLAQFIKPTVEKPPPDWMSSPGIAPRTWVEFTVSLSDHTYPIRSLPGVFSFDHLDEGTEMLLRAIQIRAGAKVLDAGCGYGMIGLYAADQGAGEVHLVDNNLLAIAACQATLAIHSIKNAEFFAADLLNPPLPDKYDLILSNPPFHTGHAVDYQVAHSLIENSFQALNPGGSLVIVANRFIRYDRLIKEIFGNVSILAESGKFHVLSGLKSS